MQAVYTTGVSYTRNLIHLPFSCHMANFNMVGGRPRTRVSGLPAMQHCNSRCLTRWWCSGSPQRYYSTVRHSSSASTSAAYRPSAAALEWRPATIRRRLWPQLHAVARRRQLAACYRLRLQRVAALRRPSHQDDSVYIILRSHRRLPKKSWRHLSCMVSSQKQFRLRQTGVSSRRHHQALPGHMALRRPARRTITSVEATGWRSCTSMTVSKGRTRPSVFKHPASESQFQHLIRMSPSASP